MGLLSVLGMPVVQPVRGLLFVFDKIREAVDDELHDEHRLEAMLMTLSLQVDEGEISESEYRAEEEEILRRLSAIREYKKSLVGNGAKRRVARQ